MRVRGVLDVLRHHTGALGGTRTPNLLIRSQMLYPLSYERWCLASLRHSEYLLCGLLMSYPNWVSDSVFPSGSANQATLSPEGAVQMPSSSWLMPSNLRKVTP
jgi:hypothetical protein